MAHFCDGNPGVRNFSNACKALCQKKYLSFKALLNPSVTTETTISGNTILHEIARFHKDEFACHAYLEKLREIEEGDDKYEEMLNQVDRSGRTAILIAVEAKNTPVFLALLKIKTVNVTKTFPWNQENDFTCSC